MKPRLIPPRRRPSIATWARVVVTLFLAIASYTVLLQAAPSEHDATAGRAVGADGTGPGSTQPVPPATNPWAETFGALARQADAGSVPAARLALEMVRHGPTVYGQRFEAGEPQQRRWQSQLVCTVPPCAGQG